MTAYILENIDCSFPIAHHDHRNTQKVNRFDHPRLIDVLAKPDCGPVVAKQCILLSLKHGRVDIAIVLAARWLPQWVIAHSADQS